MSVSSKYKYHDTFLKNIKLSQKLSLIKTSLNLDLAFWFNVFNSWPLLTIYECRIYSHELCPRISRNMKVGLWQDSMREWYIPIKVLRNSRVTVELALGHGLLLTFFSWISIKTVVFFRSAKVMRLIPTVRGVFNYWTTLKSAVWTAPTFAWFSKCWVTTCWNSSFAATTKASHSTMSNLSWNKCLKAFTIYTPNAKSYTPTLNLRTS